MKKYICIVFLSFLLPYNAICQKGKQQQLLDLAINGASNFLYVKPLAKIRFDKEEIIETLKTSEIKSLVDTNAIIEIIDSFQKPNYADWTYFEIKNFTLIGNDSLPLKNKLSINDNKAEEEFSNLLEVFGETDFYRKNVNSISRPLLNKTQTHAFVSYEQKRSSFESTITIKLFVYKNNKWYDLGIISALKSETIIDAAKVKQD